MTDDEGIPDFLRREAPAPTTTTKWRRRERKIAYPKDGYAAKGLRKAARERLIAKRRKHAEKCRERT